MSLTRAMTLCTFTYLNLYNTFMGWVLSHTFPFNGDEIEHREVK